MNTISFKKYFILLLLWIISFQTHSQVWKNIDANWVFGQYYHLNFMGTSFDTLPGTQLVNYQDLTVSVSDYDGNLLFYSNGVNVWNANNTIMPWSQAASPGGTINHISSIPGKTGRVTALHVPLNIDKYYLFTFNYSSGISVLASYYSEIDMSYGMGLGDINPLKKNILLENNVLGDLHVVNHQNGYDQWVILYKSGTDTVLSYLLTENGFTDLVISKTGPILTSTMVSPSPFGIEYCQNSPDGKLLLLDQWLDYSIKKTNLYTFDDSTGRVIHLMNFDSLNNFSTYFPHFEFSPNSQYLYFDGQNGIPYKMDVSSGIPAQIIASTTLLPIPSFTKFGWFRTAIDGKMYFYGRYNINTSNFTRGLGRFENPNNPGINVGIEDTLTIFSNLVGYFPKKAVGWYWNIAGFEHQGVCLGDTTFFQTNRPEIYLDSVKYNFGDPASGILNVSQEINPAHYFAQPGIYDVEIITYRMDIPDTAIVSIEIFANPISQLPPDTSFCAGSEISLSAGPSIPNYTYFWDNHPDSSTFTLLPLDTQFVHLQIVDTLSNCITNDSILLTPYPLFANFEIEAANCPNQELDVVYTGNADSSAIYNWDFAGASHLSGSALGPHVISYPIAGSYQVSLHLIQNQCFSDTVTQSITIPDYLTVQSIIHHPTCFGYSDGTIHADTTGSNADFTFLWNNGDTVTTITNLNAGWYFLTISYLTECHISDSFLLVQPNPIEVLSLINNISAPAANDGSIEVFVSGGTPTYAYHWSNGATVSLLENLAAGTYYLTISDFQACEWNSSFVVQDYMTSEENYSPNLIKVYPNPGKDRIVLEWINEPLDAIFRLYDKQGRLLIEEAIAHPSVSIHAAALSPGEYTWLITSKDELLGQGIWVKSEK